MRRWVLSSAVLIALVLAFPPIARANEVDAPAYKVGTTTRRFHPPEPYDWRGAATHALVTRVWYPADAASVEKPILVGPPGGPANYEAGNAAADAALTPIPRRFPLILLSHGTGGTAQVVAWLGVALAAHGAIVAAVNHPGNNALEPYTVQGFVLWWERARDISAVLDAMLADPQFGGRIDRDRIAAAGHSAGGYTMIELAGGIGSMAQFQATCRSSPGAVSCQAPPEFADLVAKAASLAQADPAFAAALAGGGASFREPRLRAVFAMAPALGPAFAPESLKSISMPVAIVAGAGDRIAPVEANAEVYAAAIPNAALTIFPGAVGHYVFADVCTEAGRSAAPPVCVDEAGVDRAAVHRETAAKAIAFFDEHWR